MSKTILISNDCKTIFNLETGKLVIADCQTL